MDLAERLLAIPKVMDAEDLNNPNVDELSVMTYISYFCGPGNQLLIDWIRKKIPDNNIRNLSTDWNSGVNLGALGEACFPGLCPDWDEMEPKDGAKNNEKLLGLMKGRLGLQCPVTAAEMADPKIDELIMATYLSQFRNAKLKASPEEFGLRVPSLPTGAALVKEPVAFEVDLSEQTANLKDDIRISAHGPSADVKVNVKPKGKYGLEATFVPTEAGSYDVMAVYNDENISGSPFTLPVADPSKCSIFGDIPSDMQLGKEESFVVKVREAGLSKLECTVEGEGDEDGIEAEVVEQENDQYEVKLVPKNVGPITLHLKWAGVDIPRTPFRVNVCDTSKVSVSGIEKEGKVGDPVTFTVTAKQAECGKGELEVVPRGPSANYKPEVQKTSKDNTDVYEVNFVPWEVGPHKVDIRYGGDVVPKSPLSINIIAAPDAMTCSASGKGLKKAVAGEKTSFQILSPESGLLEKSPPDLSVSVKSPSSDEEASPEITDNGDGSYTVNYTPPSPGQYGIRVKFYDKDIPGSPFKLDVVPSADASKCKAYGPALHPNSLHIAGNPLDMFVDTKEAGMGDLRVVILGPDESRPKVYIANEDGVYSIKWDVPESGRYHAHIWWADQYIPGSPFKIKVSPGPNAAMVKAYGPGLEPSLEIGKDSSEFTIETKDAGIGTLTIRVHGVKGGFKIQVQPISEDEPRTLRATYHPTIPGDYLIAIRWSGTHIPPGTPFKVNIREPPKPEGEKQKVKEKSLVQKPKIYMSEHRVDQPDVKGNADDSDIPDPTPLDKVKEKKKKKGSKTQSEVQLQQRNGNGSAMSAVSLPDMPGVKVQGLSQDEAIKQQQLAVLRHKGAIPAAPKGGGTLIVTAPQQQHMVSQTHTRQVRVVKTEKIVSSSSEGVKEKKKKKKF